MENKTRTIIIQKEDIEEIFEEVAYLNIEDIIIAWCNAFFKIKYNKNLHLTKENIVYINDKYKDSYHVLIESDNIIKEK